MAKKRKIVSVVKKLSFKEAEEADDKYWSEKSPEYRLEALMDLREMTYGNIEDSSIKKVVQKRNRNEEF
jgi:hypothetical protein